MYYSGKGLVRSGLHCNTSNTKWVLPSWKYPKLNFLLHHAKTRYCYIHQISVKRGKNGGYFGLFLGQKEKYRLQKLGETCICNASIFQEHSQKPINNLNKLTTCHPVQVVPLTEMRQGTSTKILAHGFASQKCRLICKPQAESLGGQDCTAPMPCHSS